MLKPCQKALKEKTDICFDFKRGKTGRGGKWLSIIFKIHPNLSVKSQHQIESTAKEIKVFETPTMLNFKNCIKFLLFINFIKASKEKLIKHKIKQYNEHVILNQNVNVW